ncbi:protein D3-like [Lycorma delicatula]|uniref:protein D3-like n=1 Tax=Lycorma delicatula TaxID=130591 RepID=UPI003F50F2F6
MSLSKKLKLRKAKERDYTLVDLERALKNAKGNDLKYYEILTKGIVPDVVDDVEHNVTGLFVKYPNANSLLGNELSPTETADEPDCMWSIKEEKEDESWFTISMTDPDAPSRESPKFREWQHWLVVNIPGMKIHEGEHLTEYFGPSPPKGTGLHRYVFLLFEQPGKIKFNEPFKGVSDMAERKSFKTSAFMKKYKLGKPIAGNYFVAKSAK